MSAALLAAALPLLALQVAGSSSCAAGQRCEGPQRGSVLLQVDHSVRSGMTASQEDDGFCCYAASDDSDRCGTCYPGAVAESGSFCALSEANCASCSSASAWCTASSSSPPPSSGRTTTRHNPSPPAPPKSTSGASGSTTVRPRPASAPRPRPTTLPGAAPAPGKAPRPSGLGGNPFAGKAFYVNPSYSASLNRSLATASGDVAAALRRMQSAPSAYWLDKKDKISGEGTGTMEGILADAASKSPAQLVVFIVYDLPNRDCHAKASNGEICCTYLPDGRCDYLAAGTCASGIAEYQTSYIDPIVAVLQKYDGRVPIVLVIEPDSLPNLSTNQGDLRCGNSATVNAYTRGVTYAVQQIGVHTRQVAIYLDAGHGGWLGWENNMRDFVSTVKNLGVSRYLRGFATNVAGYQGLGRLCPTFDYCLNNAHPDADCCRDPCGLTAQWNPSISELMYALHLRKAASEGIPGFRAHMLIDTGRNGVPGARAKCANWCNIRGAGVGVLPTAATAEPSLVDAYFWLKTPGESDGCTSTLPDGSPCPRFDADCGSSDSLGSLATEPRAPEAGAWFDFQVKMLASNAATS